MKLLLAVATLLHSATSKPITTNEVATRIVAVSKARPELLSAAVSQADPDLLRVALTYAGTVVVKYFCTCLIFLCRS